MTEKPSPSDLLDARAFLILTDGLEHAWGVQAWALQRVPQYRRDYVAFVADRELCASTPPGENQ